MGHKRNVNNLIIIKKIKRLRTILLWKSSNFS
jgi:hypothetical protein